MKLGDCKMENKTVKIQLKESSSVIAHENVINTYTKGPLYCVYVGDSVFKYPLDNIWRIEEPFGPKTTTK